MSVPTNTADDSTIDIHIPQYNQHINNTINKLFIDKKPLSNQSESALENDQFDPIDYINTIFPDESTLTNHKLQSTLTQLRQNVVGLNNDITHSLRDIMYHHSTANHNTNTSDTESMESNPLMDTSTVIHSLYQRIQLIRSKASASENLVNNITKDIKKLDIAKNNLSITITGLQQLSDVQASLVQLDIIYSECNYVETRKLIHNIEELLQKFVKYKHMQKIMSLHEQFEHKKLVIKNELFSIVHTQLMSPLVQNEPLHSQLHDIMLVIDVYDTATRTELFDYYCTEQLNEYIQLFGSTGQSATFDLIDRRYAWLRRCLTTYNDKYSSIFLSHWSLDIYLTQQFCSITKSHLYKMLSHSKPDTAAMIKALQKTIEFENELNMKYNHTLNLDQIDINDEQQTNHAAQQIRAKYNDTNVRESTTQHNNMISFTGQISDVFVPYMSSYVEMEKHDIIELINRMNADEQWFNVHTGHNNGLTTTQTQASTDQPTHYNSSNELFLYIKNSIQRCSKLSKNTTLYNLYTNVYTIGLKQYADLLESHIPQKQLLQQSYSDSNIQLLSHLDIVVVCYIINTAHYCIDTIDQLQPAIVNLIDTEYKDKIDITGIVDTYSLVINRCLQLLSYTINGKLSRALQSMIRVQWDIITTVGDESNYIKSIDVQLHDDIPYITNLLSTQKYSMTLYNLIVSTYIPRYIDTILKCKKMNEMGAQQMSLDTQVLKKILCSIPDINNKNQTNNDESTGNKKITLPHKLYIKYVNSEMSRAEALLKTLVSPNDRLIITFKALLPKSSTDELMKLMQLKNITKRDQLQLIQQYNTTVSVDDQIKLPQSTVSGFTSNISDIGNQFVGKLTQNNVLNTVTQSHGRIAPTAAVANTSSSGSNNTGSNLKNFFNSLS